MKPLALLTLASSLVLQAQTTVETTRVYAELTNRVDTKNAHLGDPVSARTTTDTRLYDGTKLPKGTKLTGHVTEIHARSNDDKSAHLAFSLDRAILHDGHEVPIHVTLAGLAAPAPMFTDSGADMSGSVAGSGRTAPGGGSSSSPTRTTTGASANPRSPLGANTGLPDQEHPVVANAGSSVASTTTLQLNHVPIATMPGVTLTSSAGATSAGALDTTGHNIELESGTQLTLNIAATAAQ